MRGRTGKSALSDDKFIIDAINAFVDDTSAESNPYRAMVSAYINHTVSSRISAKLTIS